MSSISEYLSDLEFGKMQEFRKMSVIPLLSHADNGTVYLTLSEALFVNLLKITEVDDSGSVSELKAINNSKLPVLVLDGEELVGAKQNRVLNAAVLLKGNSETIIPVSCTEEGRWSYNSNKFSDKGSVVSHSLRSFKRSSVSGSVSSNDYYGSDQSSIWNGIRETIISEDCKSPTSAYRDIYESKFEDINEYLDAFDLLEGQVGILVFIEGKIKGIDTVSSPVAYEVLHEKLLKSYTMEAVLSRGKGNLINFNRQKRAKSFINQINESNESNYKSLGHGWDHRFESDSVNGSALICQNKVIHASFFKKESSKNDYGSMASIRMRRYFKSSINEY